MEVVAKYENLMIEKIGQRPGHKTFEFLVTNKRTRATIGSITWYSQWRQYCFFPRPGTVWNRHCLIDILDFLKQQADGMKIGSRRGGGA